MTQYSDEFKEHIIQQMLPPISKPVRQLHNENGVSEQTLFKWKKQAKAGIQRHLRKLFQTDSSVFFNQKSAQ